MLFMVLDLILPWKGCISIKVLSIIGSVLIDLGKGIQYMYMCSNVFFYFKLHLFTCTYIYLQLTLTRFLKYNM